MQCLVPCWVSEVCPHSEHGFRHDSVKEACDLFHDTATGEKQIKHLELCGALSQIENAWVTENNSLLQEKVNSS